MTPVPREWTEGPALPYPELTFPQLVLAQAGTFAEGMSAGRGFIAVAIVVLGRWHPGGVAAASLVFGAASALQYLFQAMGWALPYQLFLALPYALTLAVQTSEASRCDLPILNKPAVCVRDLVELLPGTRWRGSDIEAST